MGQTIIFGTRQQLVEEIYRRIGLLDVYRNHANGDAIGSSHFDAYSYCQPQIIRDWWTDSNFKRIKNEDGSISLQPRIFDKIDEMFYFTKYEPNCNADEFAKMWQNKKLCDELTEKIGTFTMFESPYEIALEHYRSIGGPALYHWYNDMKRDSHEIYKGLFGWMQLTSFATAPKIVDDETLFEFTGIRTDYCGGMVVKCAASKELKAEMLVTMQHKI